MNDVPTFWRVYGASLLGVAALGLITLFNTLTADLASLRRELAHEQEARMELATTADWDTVASDSEARLQAVEDSLGSLAKMAPSYPVPPAASSGEMLSITFLEGSECVCAR